MVFALYRPLMTPPVDGWRAGVEPRAGLAMAQGYPAPGRASIDFVDVRMKLSIFTNNPVNNLGIQRKTPVLRALWREGLQCDLLKVKKKRVTISHRRILHKPIGVFQNQ